MINDKISHSSWMKKYFFWYYFFTSCKKELIFYILIFQEWKILFFFHFLHYFLNSGWYIWNLIAISWCTQVWKKNTVKTDFFHKLMYQREFPLIFFWFKYFCGRVLIFLVIGELNFLTHILRVGRLGKQLLGFNWTGCLYMFSF